MGAVRESKKSTPKRWQEALERAHKDVIRVRQINSTGQWVAMSADANSEAYDIDVIGAYAYGCSCPASVHGDQVCKHRAAFYEYIGLLELVEGEPPPFDPQAQMYPPLPAVVLAGFGRTSELHTAEY
jgi:hypothetical protein